MDLDLELGSRPAPMTGQDHTNLDPASWMSSGPEPPWQLRPEASTDCQRAERPADLACMGPDPGWFRGLGAAATAPLAVAGR